MNYMKINKQEIKIIVTDLDGTFLNKYHTITSYETSTIKKLNEENIHFMVASGRHPKHVFGFFKKLLTIKACLNGAIIYDGDNNLIYEKTIDKKSYLSLIELLESYKLHYLVHGEKGIYTNSYFKHFYKMLRWLKDPLKVLFRCLQIKKIDVKKIEKAYKLEFNCQDEDFYDKVQKIANLNIYKDGDYYEINDFNVSKKDAILKIISIYGIKEDEVLVFGDSINDYPMLKHFKNSVAMKNAKQNIKEVCFYETLSNHEHGVCHFIENMQDK